MENEVRLLLKNNLYEDILKITESDVNLNIFKNKTILITGAGDLLGFYLVCALLISNDLYSTGIKVIAADRNDSIFKKYGKLTYREDIEFIVSESYSNLNTVKADCLIHTSYPDSESEITDVLDFIQSNNASSVICSASDIYGDVFNGKDNISENDIGYCDCYNPSYNRIQLERIFESAALSMVKDINSDIKLARLSNVYGAFAVNASARRYIDILNCVIEKSNIEIDGDDGVLESFTYVTDAASALLKILSDGESGVIYNVASNQIVSPHITAQYCVKLFEDLGIKVIYKSKPKRLSPMAPTAKILDISKLKALGFSPAVELKDGIVTTAKILYEIKD